MFIYVSLCVYTYIYFIYIYIYLYIDKYIWGENSRMKNPRLENFAGFSPEAPQLPQRERERERESSCQHFF